MNGPLSMMNAMVVKAEQELLPARLARAGQVAEARRGRSAVGMLLTRLSRVVRSRPVSAGADHQEAERRAGERPAPAVDSRSAAA